MNEYGNPPSPPSWEQIEFNCLLILGAEDDPEDSMAFRLTRQSFALVCYGVQLAVRVNPELHAAAEAFLKKVYELSEAQNFLDWGKRPTLQAEMEDLLGGPDDNEMPDFLPPGLA